MEHSFALDKINRYKYEIGASIQTNVTPAIMDGRDVICYVKADSGQSAAFLLPIIQLLSKNNTILKSGRPGAVIVAASRNFVIQVFEI